MPKHLLTVFRIALVLVIALKIANWFLHFSANLNSLINAAMFILIGMIYILMGFAWKNTAIKVLFSFCGLYLIKMNFFTTTLLLNIVGIICILIPLLISKYTADPVKAAE